MCGIAGKISFTQKNISESEVRIMADALIHRGPDDSGVYISENKKVGLSHRRLAIIDLSPSGHQPMNYLGRYEIVFNGEIYNYQEQKNKLTRMGYKFRSQSDTEVIMALYDKYGVHCVDHLRGMFAFTVFDKKRNILFCARDRVGKKPFKYYYDAKVFIFASELKAILTQSEYHKEPDYEAIHHFLTLQYCPAPLTGFKNITKLEPAHYLLLDITKNTLTKTRYWNLDYSRKLDLSEAEWKERILAKLEEATKLRLISDVPLGAFLSGGIDSSAVVALMAKNTKVPVKTFSIGFEEQKYNELPYAKIISERFNTSHTEFIVKPENTEIMESLAAQYEEPYADSSNLATYYLTRMTRKHVTVALSGDGGDENFAGYPWYPVQKFSLFWEKFKPVNNLLAVPFWNTCFNLHPSTLTMRGRRFSETINEDYGYRYLNYLAYFTNAMKSDLYRSEFKQRVWQYDTSALMANVFRRARCGDKMDQTLFTDISTILPDDYLTKVDIASMANSLEVRSPFLDHEFMELCAGIPFGLKLKGFNNKKYLLKKTFESVLPKEILYRPKRGFMVPLEYWFKDKLAGYISSRINRKDSLTNAIFNRGYVAGLLSAHKSSAVNYSNPLWAILTLELWYRHYFR